ncbi:MAG: pilin [bacterium]|nr:pilin [bacterium]
MINKQQLTTNNIFFIAFLILNFTFLTFLPITFAQDSLPHLPGGTPGLIGTPDNTGSPVDGGSALTSPGPVIITCPDGTKVQVPQVCPPSGPGGGSRITLPINPPGSGGQQTIRIPNPLGTTTTFTQLISRIVNWLLVIGAPILTLMIIIGAFQFLTAGGEPDKVTKGRHTITYAVIGYALLLLSTGIIKIIENLLGAR